MKNVIVGSLLSISLILGATSFVLAKDANPEEPPLTVEEQAEKANRNKCKDSICKIFASKSMDGPDISCSLTKTVHKAKIEQKYLGGRISWPWGKARCKADIKLTRETLVKAMTVDGYESSLPKLPLSCELFKGEAEEKYDMSLTVAPVIKWKGGKAESVTLNIADISGSALAKGGIWTIAKANSYFGVLNGAFRDKVNKLVTKYCAGEKS